MIRSAYNRGLRFVIPPVLTVEVQFMVSKNGEVRPSFAKDSTEVFVDLKGIATVIKHPSTEVEEG